MAISLRLDKEDEKLIRAYAKHNNVTMSELIRVAVIEKIEDEYDLQAYREAIEDYNANPVSYTHEEVCKMLGIE